MRRDRGVALGGHDPLVGREQVVGVRVEIGDATDQGGPGDEVVAVGEQVGEQPDVARVTLDERVRRVVVVGLPHLPVLRVVVQADHGVAPVEQLLDDVAADEAGRTRHQHLFHFH
jgi:hypothetical protein